MTNVTISGAASAIIETKHRAERGDWYQLSLCDAKGRRIAQVALFGDGVNAWAPVKWSFDGEPLNYRAPALDDVEA